MDIFVILNWLSVDDIALATNKEGKVITFDDYGEAHNYARDNFNFSWEIVCLKIYNNSKWGNYPSFFLKFYIIG